MKTKLYFPLAVIAAITTLSCQRNQPAATTGVTAPEGQVSVTVNTGAVSKSPASSTAEKKIRTLQIFVFDATSGKKETDKYITGLDASESYTTQFTSLTGPKHVWAVANAPKQFVSDENALKGAITSLGETAPDALSMAGVADNPPGEVFTGAIPFTAPTVTVREYQSGNDGSITRIPIKLFHLGARISLSSVVVDFRGTHLEGARFEIKDVYLKNVMGGVYLSGESLATGTEQNWVNRLTTAGTGAYRDFRGADVTTRLADLDLTTLGCTAGDTPQTLTPDLRWYVFPNPATDADLSIPADGTDNPLWSTWTPRHTRLVIHAVIDGAGYTRHHTYYSFSIPQEASETILGNHTYDVTSVRITMLGKDDDNSDRPSLSGKADINVTVQEWSASHTLTPEI